MGSRKRQVSLIGWSALAGGAALAALLLRGRKNARFPDMKISPSLSSDVLEIVASLSHPPGNIAVSSKGRVFFTFHPDLRPDVKVVELKNGGPVPFPSVEMQSREDGAPYFESVLSVRIDRRGRLWTLDHGMHGFRQPRLLAFDLESSGLVHRRDFDRHEAPLGSNLNDFQVDREGRFIYVADASILRRRPALLVYDTETGGCRRLLEEHPSVTAEPFTPRVRGRPVRLLGLVPLRTGVDSIALDDEGRYLFFAPVTSRHLYRVSTEALRDRSISRRELGAAVEIFAKKPMSDGMTMDSAGNVYLSAIEHSAVMRLSPSGELSSLVESSLLRWPDGFGFGPEGWLYLTCSALDEVLLKGRAGIERHAPYHVLRFKPGAGGVPGH